MKTSPLQLKWVSYPKISYEALPKESHENVPVSVSLNCTVDYNVEGLHLATVEINSVDDAGSAYIFSLTVLAAFSFDLSVAKETYKGPPAKMLPGIIAANTCRILYAGAREMMAIITGRAPFGSVILDSVLIEPSDVRISSAVSEEAAMSAIFHVKTNEDMLTNSELVDKKVKAKPRKNTSK